MIAARFSEADDFVAELKLDASHIERKIVRVTYLSTPTESGLTAVTVEATAIVAGDDGRPDRLLMLRIYCGDLWQIDTQDAPVRERAGRIIRKVQSGADHAGLEVRGGTWIETEAER
jgi:hypothetical protein